MLLNVKTNVNFKYTENRFTLHKVVFHAIATEILKLELFLCQICCETVNDSQLFLIEIIL